MSEAYLPGLRNNLRPFLQQILQVFFVGLTIGMQRTVLPVIAESEFGVGEGSFTLLFAFVVSFGFVKGAMNFVSGRLSERVGRRPVLILGWLFALPIPALILLAPSWGWIVAANVLLGINQGFAWSMTVTSKLDIVRMNERGLATGVNEFAGYGGVALAGLVTGYLATGLDPRAVLAGFGAVVVLLGLAAALLSFDETLPFARAEAARHPVPGGGRLSAGAVFTLVSWKDRRFMALSQAGCIEKFVDALMWALVPVYLASMGASLVEIGWIVGVYGLVWGASQLWTGPLSDRVGRKLPAVLGMWICAGGVVAIPLMASLPGWLAAAAVTGAGMALLYPTLIAAVGDLSHPAWRGSSLGVYRFWRDVGYGIGALALGLAAEASGTLMAGFWLTGIAMAGSGLWLLLGFRDAPKD